MAYEFSTFGFPLQIVEVVKTSYLMFSLNTVF